MGAFHWIAVHWFITFLLFVCLVVLVLGINWNRVFTKEGYRDIPGFLFIGGILLGIYLYFHPPSVFHWIAAHYILSVLIVLFLLCLFNLKTVIRKVGSSGPAEVLTLLALGALALVIYAFAHFSAIKNWFANGFAGISQWMSENPLTLGVVSLVLVVVGLPLGIWLVRDPDKPRKKTLLDHATEEFKKPVSQEFILTCPAGIVKYCIVSTSIAHFAINTFALKERIDRKIRDILETDPGADLKEYETTLGIKVLSQRKSKGARGKSGYVGWSE